MYFSIYPPPYPLKEYVLYTRLNIDNYGHPLTNTPVSGNNSSTSICYSDNTYRCRGQYPARGHKITSFTLAI